MSRHLAVFQAALLITAAAVAGPVLAASPGHNEAAVVPPGRPLGVVSVNAGAKPARPQQTKNLSYHNGPAMNANRVYAIFWGASDAWDGNYISTIKTYFGDVAHDNGLTTNVYYSDTQYYDGNGPIGYNVIVGGSYLDTTAYPANGCTDKATSICLTDAQLQAELSAAMTANGWTAVGTDGVQNLFFLFTPKGVGSCYGSSCAYTNWCAYHSWAGSGSDAVLYANMPYAVQNYRIYTCDSRQQPNGATADATINLVSHEHNEAITDEQGSAWFDSQGAENGDKCAWNFGSASGPSGAKYNQTINGHHYYLQQEWSNSSSGCVLTGL